MAENILFHDKNKKHIVLGTTVKSMNEMYEVFNHTFKEGDSVTIEFGENYVLHIGAGGYISDSDWEPQFINFKYK